MTSINPPPNLDFNVTVLFSWDEIKIDRYNFELYHFKAGAFFLRHSVPVSIVTVSSFFCHIAVELCVVVSVCQMMSYSQSELLWL